MSTWCLQHKFIVPSIHRSAMRTQQCIIVYQLIFAIAKLMSSIYINIGFYSQYTLLCARISTCSLRHEFLIVESNNTLGSSKIHLETGGRKLRF